MHPTLKNGQIVEVTTQKKYSVGDIIIFHHPFRKITCVKRIRSINPNNYMEVQGENLESESSLGSIPLINIICKVVQK